MTYHPTYLPTYISLFLTKINYMIFYSYSSIGVDEHAWLRSTRGSSARWNILVTENGVGINRNGCSFLGMEERVVGYRSFKQGIWRCNAVWPSFMFAATIL